eukprot:scaffold13789_cov123-Isochrysis_galbana.AAC.2
MSISSYASDLSAASPSHSCEITQSNPSNLNRAWFSPLSVRCLRPCTPPVRLFSVYSLRVQPLIRHKHTQTPQRRYRRPPRTTHHTHHPLPSIYNSSIDHAAATGQPALLPARRLGCRLGHKLSSTYKPWGLQRQPWLPSTRHICKCGTRAYLHLGRLSQWEPNQGQEIGDQL